jgi:hypothetical protein
MTTNPLFVKKDLGSHVKHFHIIGLYKNRLNDRIYDTVKAFCQEKSIAFQLEAFSDGVEEDREFVVKLPAFHVYYKDEYETTFYPEESVEHILFSIVESMTKKRSVWFPFPFALPFTLRFLKGKRRIPVVASHGEN